MGKRKKESSILVPVGIGIIAIIIIFLLFFLAKASGFI
jgi:hypothetical protein